MVSAELSLLPFEQGLAALAAGLRALLEALSLATVLLGLLVCLRQGCRGCCRRGQLERLVQPVADQGAEQAAAVAADAEHGHGLRGLVSASLP
ncbi:MAG: hypothetical protein FJ078_07890 [Cyanobacteria bacterium K_DeepCast_35m_m2_155]|nr:hypothetical protein [Cyanobacteria bacterium K_DeepCast_35m_m2_155]